MLLRGTWSGGILVLILGRLQLENGQFGKPWFQDQNIEQSSSARRTANDDDHGLQDGFSNGTRICLNVRCCASSPFSINACLYTSSGFVNVYFGFLQLFLSQTRVRWTSLNSSRCLVYFGNRFQAIRAASKNLEQDECFCILYTIDLWFLQQCLRRCSSDIGVI